MRRYNVRGKGRSVAREVEAAVPDIRRMRWWEARDKSGWEWLTRGGEFIVKRMRFKLHPKVTLTPPSRNVETSLFRFYRTFDFGRMC